MLSDDDHRHRHRHRHVTIFAVTILMSVQHFKEMKRQNFKASQRVRHSDL